MELIKVFKNSLSQTICQNIINIYEDADNKKDGEVIAGINKNIKLSLDLHSSIIENEDWKYLESIIRKELNTKLEMYYYEINNGITKRPLFEPYKYIEDSGFQIQKYTANEGYYKFHNDFHTTEDNKFRVLTYLWYLNDVIEGGETEFYDGTLIKPEAGQLLIFPSTWTYPHKGNIPISNSKYIMTGWLYCKF